MIDLQRIVPLNPGGLATPLFCVHGGSGSAYSYLELAWQLGGDRPVYGIEAPGFDGDREPVSSLPALSAEYAETLREFRPGGDFSLLGWSIGGVIALDMARRLTAAGARVRQVVLVDVGVPKAAAQPPPEKEIARRFLLDMLATMDSTPRVLDRVLAGHPTAGADELFAAAESSGALPAELDAGLLAKRYAVFKAHVEASYGFEVTEPYDGPVLHLVASQSPARYTHWDKLASNLTEQTVPGDHYSMWTGNSLLRLAGLTRAALAATD